MNKKAVIAILAGIAALTFVNISIFTKESLLRGGEVIFLELAPADPRSLMQGDYMALTYTIGNSIRRDLLNNDKSGALRHQDGYAVVTVADSSVCSFVRLDNGHQLKKSERKLKFRVRGGRVKFATNAFYFQEGTAEFYEKARYGEFRLAEDGELILTGLRDDSLEKMGPDAGG